MIRKRAAILAAISAGAVGVAMTLPTGAAQGQPAGGYSQSISSGLSLPGVISTNLSPLVCIRVGAERVGCEVVPIEVGNPLNSIQLGLAYDALKNTTQLPNISTAAGSGVVTCPSGAKAGQKVEGIIVSLAPGHSARLTSATVSLSVNGESKLSHAIPVPGNNESPAISAEFGLC